MDLKEIKRLVQMVEEAKISHFSIEIDNMKVEIKKDLPALTQSYVMPAPSFAHVAPQHVPPVAHAGDPVLAVAEDEGLVPIKSQMVGTFYAASSAGAAPYVKVGDRVEVGQVVCIVEAMKLFNEIESDLSGTIEKVCVTNASPVEYGQTLFLIRVD